MLRRYLILNGISTAVLYGAVWAVVPSMSSVNGYVATTIDSYITGNMLLAPLLNRVVTVAADVAAWF